MKALGYYILYLIMMIFIVPFVITAFFSNGKLIPSEDSDIVPTATDLVLRYIDPQEQKMVSLDFESYITGVVAAEMPALFEMEALKAQAVAARTYALRHVDLDMVHEDISYLGQAYITPWEMEQRWGSNFETYFNRISDAVFATAGETIQYEGDLIEAVFHSTSAGMTENSEDVWATALPYLRSVASPYDEMAPGFEATKAFTTQEVVDCLRGIVDLKNPESILENIHILDYTYGGYVKTVQIEDAVLTGGEVRAALGLRSANFALSQGISPEGAVTLIFTTKGYGHGAGMSQYGANFMAKAGYDYREILAHFYQGTDLGEV